MSPSQEFTYKVPKRGSKPGIKITINTAEVPHLSAELLYQDLNSHSDSYSVLMTSGKLEEINRAELAFDELLVDFPHIALGIIGYGFKMCTGSEGEMQEARMEAITMLNYQRDLKANINQYPNTKTIYESLSA